MKDVERICGLLFELSSNERMHILLQIQKQGQKLSSISKSLDMTVAESYRHLQRLSKEELVQKDIDGTYCLTTFGNLVLSQLPNFGFLVKNRSYLMERDVSKIPYEFINRIGELEGGGSRADEILYNLRFAEEMMQKAQEYIWTLSNQILMSALPIIEKAINEKGIEFRSILPESIVPPREYAVRRLDRTHSSLALLRYTKRVDAIIILTEKQSAFSLPDLQGRIDYRGLSGKGDPRFHQWVKDLYLYYWNNAKPPV